MLAPLDAHVELPGDWRFVLVSRQGERGLAGEAEQRAFCELPPVPVAVTRELHREVENAMLPAARAGAFEAFSRSLYRFGYLAGTCFANRQGGPFAGATVARLVATVRELGVEGVGQSSWGPTVFAVVEDEEAATRLADTLRTRLEVDDMLIVTEAIGKRTGSLPGSAMKESAGTLIYQLGEQGLEVLLVHPSGNYNRHAAWSIPKGKPDEGESLEDAARRETLEETGVTAGPLVTLGFIDYTKSSKRVHAFAGPPAAGTPSCHRGRLIGRSSCPSPWLASCCTRIRRRWSTG